MKLDFYYEANEPCIMQNDFYEFWRLSVTINAALLSVLAKNKSD